MSAAVREAIAARRAAKIAPAKKPRRAKAEAEAAPEPSAAVAVKDGTTEAAPENA